MLAKTAWMGLLRFIVSGSWRRRWNHGGEALIGFVSA
jgi:hypothetical protein